MKRPTAKMLLAGYMQGIFPMAHAEADWEVFWYAPEPRAILPLDDRFHVSRTLARTVRQNQFDIRFDTAFENVMRECGAPRGDGEGTWISEGLVSAYLELHHLGYAHSVEAWSGDQLVGGLYGIALRGLFAGESMFHRARDASKVCLVRLVDHLRERGFTLHDCQFMTEHLRKFGAVEVSRAEYQVMLEAAMQVDATF